MTSPIQLASAGPKITPYSATQRGGGAALPPYLQSRRPTSVATPGGIAPAYSGQQTQPIITPKPTAVMNEVAQAPTAPQPVQQPSQPAGQQPGAKITSSNQQAAPQAPPTPPQAGGTNLNDVYNFFKSDLANQTNQALANARTDASARGVFYGTPLTGSEADINTQYLRGLGQLQAGMYGNEMQDQLARLGLASSLGYQGLWGAPPIPGNNDFFSALGSLFAQPNQAAGQSPTVSSTRHGPL